MKNSIELLQAEIQMKEHEIRKMQALIADKEKQQGKIELDPDDYADQFDESLDESIPMVEIGSLTYSPSYVFQNVDPTAYLCGLSDFVDSLDVEDSDEYKALQSEIDDIQDEIDQLQSDIEDLENEIEDLENQIANEAIYLASGYTKMNTETLFTAWKAGTLTSEMVQEYYGPEIEVRFVNINPVDVRVCIAARNSRECDYWEDLF